MNSSVKCGDCEALLLDECRPNSQRQPCPLCGSMRRLLHESVLQVVNFYLQIGLKQKRKGVKRPIHEEVSGADFTRATGRYSNKVRVIDRLNNRYFECVTDMQSREVIHLREEKLSEHIGRGLAKFQDHGLPHEYIANAAYFIWEKDGRIDGHDKGHWNMAIEDLKRSAAGVPAIYS